MQRSFPRYPKLPTLAFGSSGNAALCSNSCRTIHSQSISCCVTAIHSHGGAFPKENILIWVTHLTKSQHPSLKADSRHGSEVLSATDPSCHSSELAPDPNHSSPLITLLNIWASSHTHLQITQLQRADVKGRSKETRRTTFYDSKEAEWPSVRAFLGALI